jgi:hypothetical protein
MSQEIRVGLPFPNLVLARPDGTGMELYDLWKKQHALLLFQKEPHPDVMTFLTRFQEEAKTFEWLNTVMLPVFPKREAIPTPWPAPGYPALYYNQDLPEGVDWGKLYVVSKNKTLYEVYPEPGMISVARVERDLLVWEANHCLPG